MFDVGNTCSFAIERYMKENISWRECGLTDERSNGNGSLMRIHPFVLYTFQLNTNIKTETYVENEDAGKFYITNKRVIFVGNKNNFSYYFSQILKSELINVGLVFQKENTVSAKIVELTNYELPLLILSRILKG